MFYVQKLDEFTEFDFFSFIIMSPGFMVPPLKSRMVDITHRIYVRIVFYSFNKINTFQRLDQNKLNFARQSESVQEQTNGEERSLTAKIYVRECIYIFLEFIMSTMFLPKRSCDMSEDVFCTETRFCLG